MLKMGNWNAKENKILTKKRGLGNLGMKMDN